MLLTIFGMKCSRFWRTVLTAWQTSHCCSNFIFSMRNANATKYPQAKAPLLKHKLYRQQLYFTTNRKNLSELLGKYCSNVLLNVIQSVVKYLMIEILNVTGKNNNTITLTGSKLEWDLCHCTVSQPPPIAQSLHLQRMASLR